jgi:hypothetical protein
LSIVRSIGWNASGAELISQSCGSVRLFKRLMQCCSCSDDDE